MSKNEIWRHGRSYGNFIILLQNIFRTPNTKSESFANLPLKA